MLLPFADLAKARVKSRVEKGGHNILPSVVERRYKRGLNNFFTIYKKIADSWMIYDNSKAEPTLIAVGSNSLDITILNTEIWFKIAPTDE